MHRSHNANRQKSFPRSGWQEKEVGMIWGIHFNLAAFYTDRGGGLGFME